MWSNLNLANEVATKRIIFCGLSLIRAVSAGSDFSLDSAVFSLQLFFFYRLDHDLHALSSKSFQVIFFSYFLWNFLSLVRSVESLISRSRRSFSDKKTTDWENINILFSFYWCSEARSNEMSPTMMRSHLSPSVTKFFLWSREIGSDKEWHRVDD